MFREVPRRRGPGPALSSSLGRLARLHGVQTAYVDATGRRRTASPEALLAVLRALGAPVERMEDVPAALAERELALRRPGIEPVLVAWEGRIRPFVLRGAGAGGGAVACRVRLEDGGAVALAVRAVPSPPVPAPPGPGGTGAAAAASGAGAAANAARVASPAAWLLEPEPVVLPYGYHRLEVEAGGAAYSALIIAAPRRAYTPASRRGPHTERDLGVFLPLYALHERDGWGAGDVAALGRLAEWAHGLGCRVVGTLPLLAALLDTPFEPGPYSPASRLFWNELYVDPLGAPGLDTCARARAALESPELRQELARLREAPLVDYERLVRAKRAVLRPLAACFFESGGDASSGYRRFLAERPEAERYARFMAACATRREAWTAWPERLREADLRPGDYDEEAFRYHLYVQWLLDRQLGELSAGLRARGQRLYLDLPLGVHPAGYDVWSRRELFAGGASAGSPPDAFFSLGQNWGFPPLRPDALRETGHAYVIDVLRATLRHAGMLRIDHVMALHRLFWIPAGMEARDGVYVRYPAEELYAVHCLESARHAAVIVGEDLGTVPAEVRRAMGRHGFQRMWVFQFEVDASADPPVRPATPASVASPGTHDTPTFSAFWEARDVADREALGLLDAAAAASERAARARLREAVTAWLRREGWLESPSPTTLEVLRACLASMAAGRAGLVLVNLEDLWGELLPQNVPGTGAERPNWRRKARHALEEFRGLAEVVEPLARMRRLRSGTGSP